MKSIQISLFLGSFSLFLSPCLPSISSNEYRLLAIVSQWWAVRRTQFNEWVKRPEERKWKITKILYNPLVWTWFHSSSFHVTILSIYFFRSPFIEWPAATPINRWIVAGCFLFTKIVGINSTHRLLSQIEWKSTASCSVHVCQRYIARIRKEWERARIDFSSGQRNATDYL